MLQNNATTNYNLSNQNQSVNKPILIKSEPCENSFQHQQQQWTQQHQQQQQSMMNNQQIMSLINYSNILSTQNHLLSSGSHNSTSIPPSPPSSSNHSSSSSTSSITSSYNHDSNKSASNKSSSPTLNFTANTASKNLAVSTTNDDNNSNSHQQHQVVAAGNIINKLSNLHLLQSIVNGTKINTDNNATSTVELSPASHSSASSFSPSATSPISSVSTRSDPPTQQANNNSIPDTLQRLIKSDMMYKCSEANLIDTINSIKLDMGGVDVCQVMCDLLEKWCFLMVDWARQSIYFKEIKIDDQIKLLKNSWVDILILDLMWKQCRSEFSNESVIIGVNNQPIRISSIKHQGLAEICRAFMKCVAHFRSVNWQYAEYLALKYLVLFDPDVSGISNPENIEEVQQHVSSSLVEYTTISGVPEKFAQLLLKLPDIKLIGVEIKQLLSQTDMETFNGSLLEGCLLGEMLYGPSTVLN